MISPQMVTDIVSPYPPTMQELERKVADLENEIIALRSLRSLHESNLERLRDYLIEETKHSDLDEDAAEHIASIMHIELTKEYYYTATVRFSGTVMAGPNDDVEEMISNMNYDMNGSYHTDVDFQLDDVTVDDVDIDEA